MMIGGPMNFKHIYHFGGGDSQDGDQLSQQTSSSILRSENSSESQKSPNSQSDHIDKKYSHRSFYKEDY